MSEPLGYNPVGESAPGLPQHDRQLPGHVPGTYTPASDSGGPGYTLPPMTSSGPPTYFETVLGKWTARVVTLVFIGLFLPLHLAIYPIAGAVGFAAGYAYYLFAASPYVSRDDVLSWAWFVAFLAFLPAVRFENDFADRVPAYRTVRHWVRLVLIAGWFYWFDVYEQGDAPGTAMIVAVVCAAISHFILRWGLTEGLWAEFQKMTWLRK